MKSTLTLTSETFEEVNHPINYCITFFLIVLEHGVDDSANDNDAIERGIADSGTWTDFIYQISQKIFFVLQ